MSKHKQKILVTGGAGFIGAHVVKALVKGGRRVVIVDNLNHYYNPKLKSDRLKIFLKKEQFKFYKLDITDYKKLEKIFQQEKPDKVCHLAARAGVRASLEDPFIYQEVNIRGTLNLLELAVRYQIKNFVYASSSSVYGGNKKVPFSEKDQVDSPISPYAATKKADELLAHVYSHLYQLPTTGLRFFTVYGPWGRPDMALYKFALKMIQGDPIELYNFGRMQRDFTYIDDIVAGIITSLQKSYQYEIFNLGNSKTEKLKDMVAILEEELGKKVKKKLIPMQPGDVAKTYADISKAKRKLGFNPQTDIALGIKNFVDWFKKYYRINK